MAFELAILLVNAGVVFKTLRLAAYIVTHCTGIGGSWLRSSIAVLVQQEAMLVLDVFLQNEIQSMYQMTSNQIGDNE